MKHGGKMLAWLAGSLALCTAATTSRADAPQNPYQAVVERNVFGLKPPPPPPDPEANKPPLPKITLTGIITVGGRKRALMKTPPPAGGPAKPGDPPKTEQSYILAVDERDGELQVLEIDEKAGSVKVSYGGNVTTLDFDKDGVKGVPTPTPGALPMPGMPQPMRNAAAMPGAMGGQGMRSVPVPARWPQPGGGGNSAMPQAGGAAGLSVTPQGTGLQGMNVGVNPSVNPLPVATPGFSSAEESALLLEVNRIKNQAAVEAGTMPPLPRHPLSSDVQGLLADPAPAATPAPVMALPLPPGGARQYPPQ